MTRTEKITASTEIVNKTTGARTKEKISESVKLGKNGDYKSSSEICIKQNAGKAPAAEEKKGLGEKIKSGFKKMAGKE